MINLSAASGARGREKIASGDFSPRDAANLVNIATVEGLVRFVVHRQQHTGPGRRNIDDDFRAAHGADDKATTR
jgi:hypothetical protein